MRVAGNGKVVDSDAQPEVDHDGPRLPWFKLVDAALAVTEAQGRLGDGPGGIECHCASETDSFRSAAAGRIAAGNPGRIHSPTHKK